MDLDRRIGLEIREQRKRLGKPLRFFAQKLGVSVSQMHKYETGAAKLTPQVIYEISKVLQRPPSYFFKSLQDEFVETSCHTEVVSKQPKGRLRLLIAAYDSLLSHRVQVALRALPSPVDVYDLKDPEDLINSLRQKKFPENFSFPHLIFLERHRQRSNDVDVLRALKVASDLKHIPVILFSESLGEGDVGEAYGKGASGLIRMGNSDELKHKLEKLVAYWSEVVLVP